MQRRDIDDMYFLCMPRSSWLILFRKVYRLLTVGLLIKDTETDLLMALIQVIMGILELPCKA